MGPELIIFAKYRNFRDANEDAQLLKRAGIPAVVEALNPAAALWAEEYADIVLKVPAEDEEWAEQIFELEDKGDDRYYEEDEEEVDKDEYYGDEWD